VLAVELKLRSPLAGDQLRRYLDYKRHLVVISPDAEEIQRKNRWAAKNEFWLGAIEWTPILDKLRRLGVRGSDGGLWKQLLRVMEGDEEFQRQPRRAARERAAGKKVLAAIRTRITSELDASNIERVSPASTSYTEDPNFSIYVGRYRVWIKLIAPTSMSPVVGVVLEPKPRSPKATEALRNAAWESRTHGYNKSRPLDPLAMRQDPEGAGARALMDLLDELGEAGVFSVAS
jgi:hypothetical protein